MFDHLKVLSKNLRPDFEEFKKVLKGEKRASRVHFVELLFDYEIFSFITENYLGEKVMPWSSEMKKKSLKQQIDFWYRMGYDYARIVPDGGLQFLGKTRRTEDTALFSRGKRD